MARTVRNPKIDTRTARSSLADRREPYWTVIGAGCALGYRRGIKGGSWIARFRDNDARQHYQALGAADDARDPDDLTVFSFAQAQKRAREWFDRKVREQVGGYVPLSGRYTVSDAVAEYRADYLVRGGKAVDQLDASVAAWITPALGSISVDRLNKRQVAQWHQKLAATTPRVRTRRGEPTKHRLTENRPEDVRRRRSTANRVLTVLKAALNHAHREARCASDEAWRTVRAFREVDAARLRYLSDGEVRQLTDACSPDFRDLVIAALLTGCRYGELAAMTIQDFNSDAGTLQVRQSKSGKARYVVLTQEGQNFISVLATGKSGSAFFFVRSNGKPWVKSEQQRPLAAACVRGQIEPTINFHGLRHTYASRLAMRGVPLAVIAAQLGHADTRMVEKHYGHLSPNYIADTIRTAFGSLGVVKEPQSGLAAPKEPHAPGELEAP